MKKTHYRQGDVLVIETNKRPANAQEKECNQGVVLAEGEATGHCHAIAAPVKGFFTEAEGNLPVNIVVNESVQLTHQEHETIELPALGEGKSYDVIRQVQYSPGELRRVAD